MKEGGGKERKEGSKFSLENKTKEVNFVTSIQLCCKRPVTKEALRHVVFLSKQLAINGVIFSEENN